MKQMRLLGLLACLGVLLQPQVARGEIAEYCEGTFLTDDVYIPDGVNWDNMDPDDVYLRWAASQYIGHNVNYWENGYHQLAWVSSRDAAGLRWLNVVRVMDFDPNCVPLRSSDWKGSWVGDVNWVHRGGFVPEGHAWGDWYLPHGYLVWSGAGTETSEPMFVVARFDTGPTTYPQLALRDFGILPAMASNRPFRYNHDIDWDTGTVIEPYTVGPRLVAWCIENDVTGPPCDSGHRMLLAYSGDLNWITEPKLGFETFLPEPHWMGTSIRYILFRPGDAKIIDSGVIADVSTYPNHNPQWDHAIYPEVVWNAGTKQWIVVWEEMRYNMGDFTCVDGTQDCRGNYRFSRTVDEDGALGPVNFLHLCQSDTFDFTAKDGHDPPPHGIQKDYCYFLNAGNDHFSMTGIPGSDRNPLHYSLHDAYLTDVFYPERHAPRWLWANGADYADNIYPNQMFSGAPHKVNISVLQWPDSSDFGYDNASYLILSSRYDTIDEHWTNEFILWVDQPLHAITPPTYPNQSEPQEFYHELADTVDYETTLRHPWSTSTSVLSFMALWSQTNPSNGTLEMMYGNYYFVQE